MTTALATTATPHRTAFQRDVTGYLLDYLSQPGPGNDYPLASRALLDACIVLGTVIRIAERRGRIRSRRARLLDEAERAIWDTYARVSEREQGQPLPFDAIEPPVESAGHVGARLAT